MVRRGFHAPLRYRRTPTENPTSNLRSTSQPSKTMGAVRIECTRRIKPSFANWDLSFDSPRRAPIKIGVREYPIRDRTTGARPSLSTRPSDQALGNSRRDAESDSSMTHHRINSSIPTLPAARTSGTPPTIGQTYCLVGNDRVARAIALFRFDTSLSGPVQAVSAGMGPVQRSGRVWHPT